jgi:hypothetical protein
MIGKIEKKHFLIIPSRHLEANNKKGYSDFNLCAAKKENLNDLSTVDNAVTPTTRETSNPQKYV